jgi:hypothetical protein
VRQRDTGGLHGLERRERWVQCMRFWKEFGIGQQPLLTRWRFHKSFACMEGEVKFPASENRIRLRQPHFSQLNTNVRRRSACPRNVLKRSAQILRWLADKQ